MRGRGAGGSFPERRGADCWASPSSDSPAGTRPLSRSACAQEGEPGPSRPGGHRPGTPLHPGRERGTRNLGGTYGCEYNAKERFPTLLSPAEVSPLARHATSAALDGPQTHTGNKILIIITCALSTHMRNH